MMGFDAEEFWKNKAYPCWVVCLTGRQGKRKRTRFFNIQARSPERAVSAAKKYCRLQGQVYGTARLAAPQDLGAVIG